MGGREVTEAEKLAALSDALREVISATCDYLPPDGISAKECISRVLGATDNPVINAAMAQANAYRANQIAVIGPDAVTTVVRELDRAIERIMGIEIEAMAGDNLAVILCSQFDRDDDSEPDDNGWSQSATDAYDEIKREIAGLFVPVRVAIAALRAEIERLTAQLAEARESERTAVVAWLRHNYDKIAESIPGGPRMVLQTLHNRDDLLSARCGAVEFLILTIKAGEHLT
jgi:hypothetical protein